jgi:thiol peroxidase
MSKIKLKGETINTIGELPKIGSQAPSFQLTKTDLSTLKLSDLKGKKVVLNIFPSIDTSVCATSVRKFNAEASKLNNAVVVCVSQDLPFAHSRFCGAEGLKNVESVSTFRSESFGEDYGVKIIDGPLLGLMSRAVVVIGPDGKIAYTEQVAEITQEPNYEAALKTIK